MSTARHTIYMDLGDGAVAIVDSDIAAWILEANWKAQVHRGRHVYAVASIGTTAYLHRLITRARKGQIVDHINGDTLDNRRCNLRLVTAGQNRANSRKDKDNRCGLKGVTRANSGKWMAQITVAGTRYYLGVYEHKTRAAEAHDRAALHFHGAFAGLNYPEKKDRYRPGIPKDCVGRPLAR
ncbi:MAG TPA: HNH endonuclease [Chthoniobacterales bacterium]